jgi:hypothetical protein
VNRDAASVIEFLRDRRARPQLGPGVRAGK